MQTVKTFAYLHGCGHFHIAVPQRSPSPVALVGDTLPRWGREGVRALWMTAASGESAAVYCRGRRPRRPAATPKTSCYIRRIRNRPIVGKGLALSAQHMARHGNALHVCGFARGRRTSGQSLPEGASPFPTGRRLRIRPRLRKTRVLLRGAPGSARPTTWVDSPYGVSADSPDGLLWFRAAARNAGDGVPYRACADSPKVEANRTRVLPGPAMGWTLSST